MRKLGRAARKRGFACTVNILRINANLGRLCLRFAVRRVAAARFRERALFHCTTLFRGRLFCRVRCKLASHTLFRLKSRIAAAHFNECAAAIFACLTSVQNPIMLKKEKAPQKQGVKEKRLRTDKSFFARFKPCGELHNLFCLLLYLFQLQSQPFFRLSIKSILQFKSESVFP